MKYSDNFHEITSLHLKFATFLAILSISNLFAASCYTSINIRKLDIIASKYRLKTAIFKTGFYK